MKTETTATNGAAGPRRLRWQKARALAWAAALGVLLLVPQDLPAQSKDKTTTGSSSKSSSSASRGSSSARSAPSRSAPSRSSASRSSASRSPRSTPSVSSRSKASSPKAPRRSQAPTRATRDAKPIKPVPPVRIPQQPDRPGRGDEVGDPNPTTRPPSNRPGHRPGYHHYPYYPYYPSRYWSYSHYPYYFYGPYGYFYHPYSYGYGSGYGSAHGYRRGPRYGDSMGGLDLNVKPKKAEVYIDGTPVGTVDRYDGFPSYLWLEPGAYELAFYLEGYQTLTRRYSIYPGVVTDVKERLASGAAILPPAPELDRPPAAGSGLPQGETGGEPPSAGEGVGRLRLSIRPGDTAVYLDGHFLGTGEELAQLSAGLVVEPGDHVLELVRPGYVTEEVPISVPAGDGIEVDLTLRQR